MLHDMEGATIVTKQKPGRSVAFCESKHVPEDEWMPNAHFIVRAVNSHDDLVEALKSVNLTLGFLKSVVQSGESWTDVAQEKYSEATAKLDAALAKAKGDDT